jgi:alpha-2-macroglobulin
MEGEEGSTVSIRLSEGQAQSQQSITVPHVDGEPLSEDEIQEILNRLPEFGTQEGDQVDFRLAQDPIPPPLTGETVDEPFPPPEQPVQPEPVEAGPLEVLRYAPEGEIPIAPFVNVTFNQPMVPLATLEDLALEDVPVQMEPVLPGAWRWLGTKTLTFEYDSALIDRLPMATEYTLTVPAGATSATGGVLAQAVSWSFSTPAAKVTQFHPGDAPQARDPLFFIHFDQRIDPTAVLETIEVVAGSQAVSLELASEAEIQENTQVSSLVKTAPKDAGWFSRRPSFCRRTPASR